MAGFFKKAVSLFVEIEETKENDSAQQVPAEAGATNTTTATTTTEVKQQISLSETEIDKFEKHFEAVLSEANLPGPDYYEFCKTMEVLEAHIPDEKARMAACFASLAPQGLTKEILLNSAKHYLEVIKKDKTKFESAASEKYSHDVESRKTEIANLEKLIAKNSEMIQKLTKEISESQVKIQSLNKEILEESTKITNNKEYYQYSCDAIIKRILIDLNKIETSL